MYVRINNKNYTDIYSLSFAPEVDVTGNSIPVDEAYVTIKTNDDVQTGQYMHIFDDLANRWSKLWILEINRENKDCITLHAMSGIFALERKIMGAVMYNDETVGDILQAIFIRTIVGVNNFTVPSDIATMTVSGFCPEQTARDRLQWLCFTVGAFVRQSFTEDGKIEIDKVREQDRYFLEANKIKYKPVKEYEDFVSKVTITAYSFRKGTPQNTDKWVTDGTNYYIIDSRDYSIINPDFPVGLPDNDVTISGVYLINDDNIRSVLDRVSTHFFNRQNVSLDALNNFDFFPGDNIYANTEVDEIVQGFVQKMSFTFGVQAQASVEMVTVEDVVVVDITIICIYAGDEIARYVYYVPVLYNYRIKNPYIDRMDALLKERHVYRPDAEYATGNSGGAGGYIQQIYSLVLHYVSETGALSVLGVESIDWLDSDHEVVVID